MRLLPVILALLGQLAVSLVVAAPQACHVSASTAAVAQHKSCCHDKPQTPQKRHDCSGKCLMECCRAMLPAEIRLDQVGDAPAIATAAATSDFARDLTQPDAIFHPPKA